MSILDLRGHALARPAHRGAAGPGHPGRLACCTPSAPRSARAPDRTALAYFDGRLSYRETRRAQRRASPATSPRAALARGDRVAIMLQNTPHFVIALLGAWKAGATVVPVNPMYKTAEVAPRPARRRGDRAGLLGPRLGGVSARDRRRTRPSGSRSPPASWTSRPGTTRGCCPFERAAPAGRGRRRPAGRRPRGPPRRPTAATPGPRDIALISYTSGTSGTPKGATNTHGNITYNAERQRTGLGSARRRRRTSRWRRSSTSPAWSASSPPAVANAGTLVARATASRRASSWTRSPSTGPPTPWAPPPRSWRSPPTRTPPASTSPPSGSISSGGAPLPPALVEKFRDRLRPLPPQRLRPHRVHRPLRLRAARPGGARRPGLRHPRRRRARAPTRVVRIVDDARRRRCRFGEQGEIAVRGPQVVPGYWRRPEATAEPFPDGELRTGDIGFMDADGWLYVVDRKKDMINASGFKVWPREVEDVLYTHPAVREAAVVGVPDAYRGETRQGVRQPAPGRRRAGRRPSWSRTARSGSPRTSTRARWRSCRSCRRRRVGRSSGGNCVPRTRPGRRPLHTGAGRERLNRRRGRWRQCPERRTDRWQRRGDTDGAPVPQRLLAAATRLFAERGYDRTSVQEIVEAAGVTKGALYHYFGSKDDLLHEIYARVLRLQQERLDAFADADAPVEQRLRDAAADVVVTTIENLDDASIFFRSMHHLSPEKNKQVRAERRRYHERFRALIEEGQRTGVFRADHPRRPGRRLPLRLGAPPVHLVPPRRPAHPAAGRRPPGGPAAAGAAALRLGAATAPWAGGTSRGPPVSDSRTWRVCSP